MSWLQIILQFLPGIIQAIAAAINGDKPAAVTAEVHAENQVHLQKAQEHFEAAQSHLGAVKV